MRVIWAYHYKDLGEAGQNYHGSNRGSKSLRLLNPEKTNIISSSLPYFDLTNKHVSYFGFYFYMQGSQVVAKLVDWNDMKIMWLSHPLFLSLLLRQVPIPEKDTTYWCQMFKIPIHHEKHHVIKVSDPFSSEEFSLYVYVELSTGWQFWALEITFYYILEQTPPNAFTKTCV